MSGEQLPAVNTWVKLMEINCKYVQWLQGLVIEGPSRAIEPLRLSHSVSLKAMLIDFASLKSSTVNLGYSVVSVHTAKTIPIFETIFPVGERFIYPTIGLLILLQENRWTDLGIYK